ncbi:hypothetical protein BBF96_08815 [Anoxybacter fermentans]|uniref:RHS repeat-associated core domain-containing protein n=1 Tax=Anoxybacter fermentans TaxID=1323375 RepID=A0A3Q9HQP2_9FIRM|nr:RHS repeat-associated core domain-containing protein [Anoxybacter fermentans]AZR73474.1 hypothetical protein BBF96_08815 [Anoxybacter fermentans]
MTDGKGQVAWEQDYLPFGEDLYKPGTSVVDFAIDAKYKFTGQRQVIGIGLYYYGARHYDPETGRFITEDVYPGNLINQLSQNLYIYVLQNPLKYVDPTGHMANLTAGTGGITSKITDEDIERLKKIVEEDDRLTEEEKEDLKDTFNQIKANNTEIENPDIKRIVELHIEGKISIDAYYIAVERIIQETGDIQKWQEYIWPSCRKVSNLNYLDYDLSNSIKTELTELYAIIAKALGANAFDRVGTIIAEKGKFVGTTYKIVGFDPVYGDIIEPVKVEVDTFKFLRKAGYLVTITDFAYNEYKIILDSNLTISQRIHKSIAEAGFTVIDVGGGVIITVGSGLISGPVGVLVGFSGSVSFSIWISNLKNSYYEHYNLK